MVDFSILSWFDYLLLLSVLLFFVYLYLTKDYGYFDKKGIPYEKPYLYFGSMLELFLGRKCIYDLMLRLYNRSKENDGLLGLFERRNPVVILGNQELLKLVIVKDFDHFSDHRDFSLGEFFEKNLFSQKGLRWKNMRSTLSPAFTASKQRYMFDLIDKCAQQTDLFLQREFEKQKSSGQKEIMIKQEMKEFFTRFANDAIATSVFGIEIDSLADPQNEFFLMGKDIIDLTSGIRKIKTFFSIFNPFLLKVFFKGELISPVAMKYFREIIEYNLEKRRKEKIVRPDMINLLMEAQANKNNLAELTDEDIFSQAILFFIAGFETVSSTLSLAVHQLAEFPEIQEKLAQEIDSKLKENNGVITYDVLMQDMPYLDMVLNETQRRIPALAFTDRVCTKPYTFPSSGKRPEYKIKTGEQVWIPINGFHHDKDYFPNPEQLIPERWSDESQHDLNAFMPFGLGPRICIANRFARMETKLALIHVLKNSKVVFIEETENPIHFTFVGVTSVNKHGFWLGFKPRH